MRFISMQELGKRLDRDYQNLHMALKKSMKRGILVRDQHYVHRQTTPKYHLNIEGVKKLGECLRLKGDEERAVAQLVEEMQRDKINDGTKLAIAAQGERIEAMQAQIDALQVELFKTNLALSIARARIGFTQILAFALCNAHTIANPMEWAQNKVIAAGKAEELEANISPTRAHHAYTVSALDDMHMVQSEWRKWANERQKREE